MKTLSCDSVVLHFSHLSSGNEAQRQTYKHRANSAWFGPLLSLLLVFAVHLFVQAQPVAGNCYKIKNVHTGQYLQAMGNNTVQLYGASGQNDQIWRYENADGALRISSVSATDKVMYVDMYSNDQPIRLGADQTGNSRYRWITESVNGTPNFRVRSGNMPWAQQYAGGGPDLQIWGDVTVPPQSNNPDYIQFVFEPATCPGGCTSPTLSLNSPTCNGTTYTVTFTAQSGAIVTASTGTVSSNQVSGVPGGTNVTVYASLNGCSAQQTANSPINCTGGGGGPIVSGNCYLIKSTQNSNALQAMGDGGIQQQGASGQNNQVWKAEDVGNAHYKFTIQDNTSRVIQTGSGNGGDLLTLTSYTSNDHQQWTIEQDGTSGNYRISTGSGATWDLQNFGNSPPLQLWGTTSEPFYTYRSFRFESATCLNNPPPPPPPSGGSGTGLTVNYFNSFDLSGGVALNRTEGPIDFGWDASQSPGTGVNTDFSARWEGQIEAPVTGTYSFYASTDDGVRLWINGQQVIDAWTPRGETENTANQTFSLQAGQKVSVKMEFFDSGGPGAARLRWSYDGQGKQAIPQSRLYPSGNTPPLPNGGNGTGLLGTYYNNQDLSGYPVLQRLEPTINFTWDGGGSSPFPGVNASGMSARWEGQVEAPVSGNYVFATNNDDATKLWINEQLVINDWPGGHGPTLISTSGITLSAGQKYSIRLEFNQGGGGAQVQLLWSYPGQNAQVIPQNRFYANSSARRGDDGGGIGRILLPGDQNLDPWDWTIPTYSLWYNTDKINPKTPSNPFLFNSAGRLYKDMYSSDGWMLVARDFGTPTAAIRLPFYILYNKYRGILRSVIYYPDDQEAVTNHSVMLSFDNNPGVHPALFNFAEKSPDKSYLNDYDPSARQTAIAFASPGSFIITDFNVIGYDPSLFDPSNHNYDELSFSLTVKHVLIGDVDTYSNITLKGTVQPTSLGPTSDAISSVSSFFTKGLDKVKTIINKENVLGNVFDLINAGNDVINGLFGGGGGYNVSLQGEISTNGTISTKKFGGTLSIYVKPKPGNVSPNYAPLQNIYYGLLNLNKLSSVVHTTYVNGTNSAGQTISIPKYSIEGIDVNPILNPYSGMRYVGVSASYYSQVSPSIQSLKFGLQPASGSKNSGACIASNAPFGCFRYEITRDARTKNVLWTEFNTDDLFNVIGVNFTLYHPGYGPPFTQTVDPDSINVYRLLRLSRTFVNGGRQAAAENQKTMPYPNPFNQQVTIPLPLAMGEGQRLVQIFSEDGKQVWETEVLRLVDTEVTWDGKSNDGLYLPAGVYLCRVSSNHLISDIYKVVLIR